MIKQVSDYHDCKRRLNNTDEYVMVAEMIFNDFQGFTLEEIRLVCDRMKLCEYGEYYERLKAGEFRKALLAHCDAQAGVIEEANKYVTRGTDNPTNVPEYDAEAAKLAWRMKNNPFLIPDKNNPEKK